MKLKILFVCTGNTCRSSMAEYIFKDLAESDKYEVMSAGVSAVNGKDPAPQAKQIMSEKGIDISNHQTQKLTEDLVTEADLILTMTHQHKSSVLSMFNESEDKVFTLKEFVEDIEELTEITDEIDKIYKRISNRREKFLDEKGSKIERLRKRHQELIQEIGEVEDELNRLEGELSKEVADDKDRLDILQNKVQNLDISDPFGQPVSVYRQCAEELEEYIKLLLKKIE
ncbi:low molecular weight protein arginine phosphatase [Sporohalobacter salinus]|uniref:low molecular weight protein arginine phosphatase n=1 Tax=Sporohalobacter salinus TaxID=1494606 RepID=UPI001961C3DF|nr:low molecular weight protein arginine phosphatase [Sporohalobacter salinus]MBM7622887.1 protein-tyrosine phosphatase [Sporohalobacter salinus]